MSWELKKEVMIQIIDSVQSNVFEQNTKIDLFVDLIQIFLTSGQDVIEDLLGIDEHFDRAYYYHFPDGGYEINFDPEF